MKGQFLLFGGDTYYPGGGVEDLIKLVDGDLNDHFEYTKDKWSPYKVKGVDHEEYSWLNAYELKTGKCYAHTEKEGWEEMTPTAHW